LLIWLLEIFYKELEGENFKISSEDDLNARLKQIGYRNVSRKVIYGRDCDIYESIQFLGEIIDLVAQDDDEVNMEQADQMILHIANNAPNIFKEDIRLFH
jgi:hypothetical protein